MLNLLIQSVTLHKSISKAYKVLLICALAAQFIFSSPGFAQSIIQKPEMKFQRTHEGLISNQVSAIYQDTLGYMWIGTYSGLHRYDGINFHVYSSSADKNSISNNYIGAIYEDKNNELWIGTGAGVEKYNRGTDNFINFELSGSVQMQDGESVLVNSILEDKNGQLWASSSGKGLFFFDKEKQQFIQYDTRGVHTINSIAIDDNNHLWIAANEDGLGRLNLNNDEIMFYTHDPSDPHSIASNMVSQVVSDDDGSLWVGTSDSGLDRMITENGKTVFRHYRNESGKPNILGNNSIFTLYKDKKGRLWAGNENGGLHLYNEDTDSFFFYDSHPDDPYSLSHNSIWSIFQDREERFWVGTAQAGVNIVDKNHSKFAHYYRNAEAQNSINNDIIRDIWEDADNNIWLATDGGGLNYFDRKTNTFKAYEHQPDNPQSLGSDAVVSLDEDDEQNLWVGTWGGGLNILTDKQSGTFMTFNEKIDNDDYPIQNVFDVHFDDPYIWISAFNEGLYKYNKNSGELELFSYTPDDPLTLSTNFLLSIYEDSEENIWIATLEGLNLLRADDKEKGIFRKFHPSAQDSSSIAGNSVRQIFEDSNRNIWIATDGGLSRYIKGEGRFRNYYQADGLPVDEIRSIIEDDNGNLWIGTIQGLSKFDPENSTFTNFDKSDGLQSNEFSRYSVHKTQSGELLFGGLSGFNLFHPEKLEKNPHIPPVYLTDFKLFNKSIDVNDPDSPLEKHISITDTLVLSYQDDVITFDFIALNYTRPEYNQYAYKVEGFEEDWNYVGTQRNATYTNLDPGEYVFRVKASNNDDVWNEDGASLTLIITPPFWQTVWFYLLSTLFIAAVIFSVYRIRVRSIREQNRQLENQVAKRTEELKERNKDLKNALQELESTKDELVEKAHKAGMADIATGVLHNVGNILTSLNTSASLIEDSVKKSKIDGLVQANVLLREHIDKIEDFILHNPKGKSLMEYYLKLEDPLKKERENMRRQSERLMEKIELINEVVAAQQNFAGIGMNAEKVSLSEVIENALSLQAGSIERHSLDVEKDLQATEPIITQRSKLIHVLVNIFKNAKEAMVNNHPEEKKILIKTWQEENKVFLSVTDNGAGIQPEHLDKIFTHGFTTKKNGHGFGLHSSANYMTEMNGQIKVHSKGPNQGTTFTLSLPVAAEITSNLS